MPKQAYGLNELREMFLEFFESKDHLRLPSFSLVPQNDPSLLLINAGMSPMKTWFTGEQTPPRKRVTTCQKCIRTADIENIGKTARHGTYFEMLGNFSFGDYFKLDAIQWSWEFLTQWVGLEPDRLYPSVYLDDDEAFEIWNKVVGIPAEKIFRFGKADNFWEHGSGPCGPCSEIYYDRGEQFGCGKPDCTVGCDCDRYMEVWNNVFTQFDNDGHDNYTPLEHKNIDTGMGLERLAVVSQGVDSMFDVDTIMNITAKVSAVTGMTYGQSHKGDVSLRIITDHIRSATFMIGDGILPSNEGRGYVLRRLLRRAARQGKLLGVNDPFLYQVCETVIHENLSAYPELQEKQSFITRVIRVEEENFARTIDTGLRILSDLIASCQQKGETVLSGADAFRLYDTYGFPLDLTTDVLEENGMTADEAAFQEAMEEQKVRARTAGAVKGELAWMAGEKDLELGAKTVFTGYQTLEQDGCTVTAIISEGELCSGAIAGSRVTLVLDRTSFYAESGGQVADHGTITAPGLLFRVQDVQKDAEGVFLHTGMVEDGTVEVGQSLTGHVDAARRQAIMRAHSCTHLLQKALRTVLGSHVEQAGSLVEPDHLRFDFTHFSAMTQEELQQVSDLVQDMILEGMDVTVREMPISEAKQLGAMALFGEKYGAVVRVVTMGDKSVEFCGGTHLCNTARVGSFRILSEASVAAGVRRIEAIVGKAVPAQTQEYYDIICRAAEQLKSSPVELLHRAAAVMAEQRELRQGMDRAKTKLLSGQVEQFAFGAKKMGDLKVITATLDASADELRRAGDLLRDRDEGVVAVLASVSDDKITFLAVCGKTAQAAGVRAGDLVKAVSKAAGGSGGGKPDSAMGGGKDILKLDDALAMVDDLVAATLNK